MGFEQETLIYIEEDDKLKAGKFTTGFAIEDTKKRVFVNALASELGMKYLAQEGINVSNIHNLHNIYIIREEFDIADIMLPNIHIDVRMVFDENLIFIPKSHFKFELTPDIYMVFCMNEDAGHVKFLGFFEPRLINKNNQNDNYYFIEKEKLFHPSDLKSYIENFNGNTTEALSENENEDAQRLALSFIDHDISENDKKSLISTLLRSSNLREELTDFDRFEWVSYHVATNEDLKDIVEDILSNEPALPADVTDEFAAFEDVDEFGSFDTEPAEDTETIDELEINEEPIIDETEEIEEEPVTFEEEILTDEINDDIEEIMDEDIITNEIEEEELPEIMADKIHLSEFDHLPFDTHQVDELAENDDFSLGEDFNLDEEEQDEILEFDNTNFDQPIEEVEPETASFDDLGEVPEYSPAVEETVFDDNEVTSLDEFETPIETDEAPDEETPEDNNTYVNTEITQSFDNFETTDSGIIEEVEDVTETVSLEELSSSIPETTGTSENSAEDFFDTHVEEITSLENEESTPVAYENSTVINNAEENFTPGEIQIDINQNQADDEMEELDDIEKLGVLYNETSDILTDADKNMALKTSTPEKGKKAIIFATTIITALAALLVYAAVNKTGNNPTQSTNNMEVLGNNPNNISEQPLPDNMDTVIPKKISEKPKLEDVAKEAEQSVNKAKAPAVESPYIDVQKLSWEVPDYVSYNDTFKKYLQTAGKSLKLSLSSDLLLATEYAYSNQIKVDVTISKEGSLQNANILQSSGSTQIDNIVLRTVKETLKVVKAPPGVIVGDNIHMILKIYL